MNLISIYHQFEILHRIGIQLNQFMVDMPYNEDIMVPMGDRATGYQVSFRIRKKAWSIEDELLNDLYDFEIISHLGQCHKSIANYPRVMVLRFVQEQLFPSIIANSLN